MKKIMFCLALLLVGVTLSAQQPQYTVEQRQEMLLQPAYLANWVGASFFTRSAIEGDLQLTPVTYEGGKVFYNLPKTAISVEYSGDTEVCVEIAFRLFGVHALDYLKELTTYGYKLFRSKKATVVQSDMGITDGVIKIYKVRVAGGYSVCEVVSGKYTSFTFYRSQQ